MSKLLIASHRGKVLEQKDIIEILCVPDVTYIAHRENVLKIEVNSWTAIDAIRKKFASKYYIEDEILHLTT